jgi:hypothetical protein
MPERLAGDPGMHARSKGSPGRLLPMPLWQAILYFGLPGLLFRLSLYNGTPALIGLELPPFEASVVSFTVPSAVLLALALGFYRRDGYPLS